MKRFIGSLLAGYATYVGVTWLRYGRPRRARGAARDELLDRFMPVHDVGERHHIRVAAPPEITLAAAKETSLADSRIIRGIFQARELMLRSHGESIGRRGLVDELTAIGWGVLADTPNELVLGAVTKPWLPDPTFRAVPDFASFAEPDYVKIAVTLRVEATGDGGSIFRTETRAVATDAVARRKFRIYWSLLSPGIIVIREVLMPVVAAAAERRWRIEGDDLLPDPAAQLTHAIAIAAPPADVWPWLMQMGCQRGGWYSWDVLDNAGVRSAERIIPELQHLAPGDILPARPQGSEGFEVVRVVPERALVLRANAPRWQGTWAFVLEPLPDGRTRLITRYRAAYPPSVGMAVRLPFISALHAVMERKQLRTIKHHAEHMN